jgi:hypothetical protein
MPKDRYKVKQIKGKFNSLSARSGAGPAPTTIQKSTTIKNRVPYFTPLYLQQISSKPSLENCTTRSAPHPPSAITMQQKNGDFSVVGHPLRALRASAVPLSPCRSGGLSQRRPGLTPRPQSATFAIRR